MGIFDLWGLNLRYSRTRSGEGVSGGSTDPWRQGRRPGMKVRPQLRLSGASAQWLKERVTHTTV